MIESIRLMAIIRDVEPVYAVPVSYTHLDVYKRQLSPCVIAGDSFGILANPSEEHSSF